MISDLKSSPIRRTLQSLRGLRRCGFPTFGSEVRNVPTRPICLINVYYACYFVLIERRIVHDVSVVYVRDCFLVSDLKSSQIRRTLQSRTIYSRSSCSPPKVLHKWCWRRFCTFVVHRSVLHFHWNAIHIRNTQCALSRVCRVIPDVVSSVTC